MIVGHHKARRIDDDAEAQRLLHPLIFGSPAAEKAAEDRIVEQWILRHRLDARGVDVDHRRRDLLDDRGEGQANLRGALRRNPCRVGDGRAAEDREERGEREA